MNYLVHTAGRYRAISILGLVHAAFFNCHQFDAMTYMPDEIVLARMVTTLDFEVEKAMHYHDEGYRSHNDYGLPLQFIRPMCIYSVSTTEAFFNPAKYKEAEHTFPPLCPDNPEAGPPMKGTPVLNVW